MAEYEQGLSKTREVVFSENYIARHVVELENAIKNRDEKNEKTIRLDAKKLDQTISLLLKCSEDLIERTTARISKKIKHKGVVDKAMEAVLHTMKDRQFTKGPKSNLDEKKVLSAVQTSLTNNTDIHCVIMGLPFKMPTKIKCVDGEPDLSEISFLLQLNETCRVLENVIRVNNKEGEWTGYVKFIVVTDGERFRDIVGMNVKEISNYQTKLRAWLDKLGLTKRIELVDYKKTIETRLTRERLNEKGKKLDEAYEEYKKVIGFPRTIENLQTWIESCMQNDPDKEERNEMGRFISVFQSLLFSIRYKSIEDYCKERRENYEPIYLDCMIEIIKSLKRINNKGMIQANAKREIVEKMINEAAEAAIRYVAEIKSDRDMPIDIMEECYPNSIRWTIHAKAGQTCLPSKTVNGMSILPWHGIATLQKSKTKWKQYTMPYLLIDKTKFVPIVMETESHKIFCYIETNDETISVGEIFENINRTI